MGTDAKVTWVNIVIVIDLVLFNNMKWSNCDTFFHYVVSETASGQQHNKLCHTENSSDWCYIFMPLHNNINFFDHNQFLLWVLAFLLALQPKTPVH